MEEATSPEELTGVRGDGPRPLRTLAVAAGLAVLGLVSSYAWWGYLDVPDWLETPAVFATFLGGGLAGFVSRGVVEAAAQRLFGQHWGDAVFCLVAFAPFVALTAHFVSWPWAWSFTVPPGLAPALMPLLSFAAIHASVALMVVINTVGDLLARLFRRDRRQARPES
jgi:hypothetical protein